MRPTLTTREAAYLVGVDPRSFHRQAKARDIHPLHRVRIGRSIVTVWSRHTLETRWAR